LYVSGCSLGIDLKSKPILYNYRKSLRSVLGLYREILVDVLEKNKIRENKLFSPENLENLGEVTFYKRIRMLIGSCQSFCFFCVIRSFLDKLAKFLLSQEEMWYFNGKTIETSNITIETLKKS
jgi:hypothetical protein